MSKISDQLISAPYRIVSPDTNSLSLANFVGSVVGFFNVLLPGVHPQRGHNKNRSFPYR